MHLRFILKPIKNKIKFIILFILLILTISTVMVYSIINSIKNEQNITSTLIAERLSKISELSTLKYNYSNIIIVKNSKKFKDVPIPFTEKSFFIKYSGYIKAGVDLKDLNIVVNKNDVIITLKKSKILDNVINNEDLLVYDEKTSMFNKLSMQDIIDEISNEKIVTAEDLLKKGFLDEANNNAKLLLKGFLLDMGFENVTIVLK
jgi:hypothetical protein